LITDTFPTPKFKSFPLTKTSVFTTTVASPTLIDNKEPSA
jgi:hypothetical protein